MARLFGKRDSKEATTRGISAALNPTQLRDNSEPVKRAELDRIIKTTDAMNIALSSDLLKTTETLAPREQSELNSIREAIARSYDLARRKITTQYEQVILSNNYVDNPFLAVQVTIKNIDRNWEVQNVERVIRKFTDAIVEQVALGKTVYLNDDLIIEPLTYVDKILPTWKITPKFAILTNAIKWEQIVADLGQDGEVSLAEAKEIAREAVDAITTNVKNGYLVKIGRFIIMQLQVNVSQRVILFSNDTLERINEIHERYVKTGEQKDIRKYDALVHFDKTLENVERGFYSEDIKTPTLRPDFVPRDLTQEIEVKRTKGAKAKIEKTAEVAKVETPTAKPKRRKGLKAAKSVTSTPAKTTERKVEASTPSQTPRAKTTSDRKRRVGKKASKPAATIATPAVSASQPSTTTTTAPKTSITKSIAAKPQGSPKAKTAKKPASAAKTAAIKPKAQPSLKVQATKPQSFSSGALVSTPRPSSTSSIISGPKPINTEALAGTTEVVTTTTTTKVITTTPPTAPALKSRIIKPKPKVGSFTYTNLTDKTAQITPSASSVKPVKSAKKRK